MTTKNKPILACDVDLCVVRSDLGWMVDDRKINLVKFDLGKRVWFATFPS